ncbi:MAG: hypothetical protein JHD36_10270 [Ilumatobacteraceae bacterium]|nr:hypothetical protein [Ilumatobacteraceae bacterium]
MARRETSPTFSKPEFFVLTLFVAMMTLVMWLYATIYFVKKIRPLSSAA